MVPSEKSRMERGQKNGEQGSVKLLDHAPEGELSDYASFQYP